MVPGGDILEIDSRGPNMKSKFETAAASDWGQKKPSCIPARHSTTRVLTTVFCGMESAAAASPEIPSKMGVHDRQIGRVLPFFGLFL
jgi:hypothetical protein